MLFCREPPHALLNKVVKSKARNMCDIVILLIFALQLYPELCKTAARGTNLFIPQVGAAGCCVTFSKKK